MPPDDSEVDSTPGETDRSDVSTPGETDRSDVGAPGETDRPDVGAPGETDRPDGVDDPADTPKPGDSPKWGLPAHLSETVPDRRAYGLERMTTDSSGGLLSPRERQYVQHADRLDQPDQATVETVIVERVDEFVDADWPLIQESYPEVAATLRETICSEGAD